MKTKQWLRDRLWLRDQLRSKPKGGYATVLCVLVSHMRGKLHMRTYKLKEGGWRSTPCSSFPNVAVPTERVALLNKMYGDSAQFYYNISVISNLADQEVWLGKAKTWYDPRCELEECAHWPKGLIDRALDTDNYDVKESIPAEEVQEAQTA